MRNLTFIAIKSSIAAGEAIRKIYFDGLYSQNIEMKTDSSPVTIADKESNDIICNILNTTGINIISEESDKPPKVVRKKWKRYWLVDPLDGTREFIKRNGQFTVNIALIEQSRSVLGVIYVPESDMLYYCNSQIGSFMVEGRAALEVDSLERLMELSTKLPLDRKDDRYVVAKSISFSDPQTDTYIEQLSEVEDNLEVVEMGGALKFVAVAKGDVDSYPRLSPISCWDIAAGVALVKFSEGIVYDLDSGSEYLFALDDFSTSEFAAFRKNI